MKPRALLALDTEDNSAGTPNLFNIFDGDRHVTWEGVRSRPQIWAWLRDRAPAHTWACNMEYDLVNAFGDWLGKLVTLQYVRSGLMRGVLREARGVTCFDTLRHWPASVEEMGAKIGLPKLAFAPESVAYCRRDTEIVWRFVRAMLDRYDALGLTIRSTLPAMALQWFRKSFYTRPWAELPEALLSFFRSGYYGGRVEVFRVGPVEGPVYVYDVNSLFPSVMVGDEHPYPRLDAWRITTSPDWQREGMAELTIRVPLDLPYPGLPVRAQDDLLYPVGTLRGTWPYPEIRQAIADGAEVMAVHSAVEFSRTERPFERYVQTCYERRLAAGDTLDNLFWKLMMNALYGKFGQRGGLTMIFDDREMSLPAHAAHVNVIWSAYVTSYARLALLRHLRRCGTVYYTDTDSLWTPITQPTGTGLGELKLEDTKEWASFVGNKLYMSSSHGRMTAKAKGVPRKHALDFVRTGRAVFRRPARFRESRARFVRANVWYDVEKERDAVYTKRRVFPDGLTAPWAMQEYERMMAAGDTKTLLRAVERAEQEAEHGDIMVVSGPSRAD